MANVTQLGEFDEIIDVRSPAEFAEDHIPGAVNRPVLSNEERARVGTLYKSSPFEARKLGAVLVARNIARHLEESFASRPRSWRPLVYCWRGGQRSGAMSHVLRQIGWPACALEGGYKSWRRHVLAGLAELPRRFSFRVVCGATGSGKSRLLEALAAQGAQVLDLERLAAHRGSVLGGLPEAVQPSQKMFESRLFAVLRELTFSRPVFVEAESRRIGRLQLPQALIETMRASPCLVIEASRAARIDFLLREYGHFLAAPAALRDRLATLRELQGGQTVARWNDLVDARDWPALVGELLEKHYDPLYARSQARNYVHFARAPRFPTDDLSAAGLAGLAAAILAAPT